MTETASPPWGDKLIAALEGTALAKHRIVGVKPLAGGACQENLALTFEPEQGAFVRAVLRTDAPSSLPGSISRAEEANVIEAAVAAGIRTPAVIAKQADLIREGATSYLMEWRGGVAIGRKVTRGEELAGARELLPKQLAEELAKVHRVPPSTLGLESGLNPDPKANPQDAALAFCAEMLKPIRRRPALTFALNWLEDHKGHDEERVFNHGDFRTGNFLVGEKGLIAVLDWEFAQFGTRASDIAWFFLRDWRFGRTELGGGGICTRAVFLDAYEPASESTIDADALLWWEVLKNVWWAAGCVFQAKRYTSGQVKDLELAAIGRRVAEMEWEALRLIRRGPFTGRAPHA